MRAKWLSERGLMCPPGLAKTPSDVALREIDCTAEAFRNYRIDLTMLEPAEAAARIRTSAIRETLLAFSHEWLYWVWDADRDLVRAVVDRADDDEWRRAIRGALAVNDTGALKVMIRAREATTQPLVVLIGLGGALFGGALEKDALALLRQAQQRHPEDFWINFQLGYFLQRERPQEAVVYFRVAVAIRPGSAQAFAMLGRVLFATGDATGAIAAFRKAVGLNPTRADAKDLTRILASRGGLEGACVAWEKVLERNPPDYDSWYGYAQLCLFLGKDEAYGRARKALPERFGETNDWIVAERTSLACLILPSSGDELRRAVGLADRAVAAAEKSNEPGNPYVRFVKGLAEYRQGRNEQAVPLLQESAASLPNRPGPRLVLAMATVALARDWGDSATDGKSCEATGLGTVPLFAIFHLRSSYRRFILAPRDLTGRDSTVPIELE